ncbi:RAMP superfamily CRISPR-associated protein [Clostridium felsineum]|uniref:RAMP superfamily CRISPR-associated protein n=1 Tax=Clostridium felsineum TaxID=36839 RepID=UPI00098CBBDA|nr:RAMP superfamily CRISPR-associated protein [Clostridium felsineum]URZ15115.1 hypothetical protein CLFE_011330 [Clostridium felsineum DSM 794]
MDVNKIKQYLVSLKNISPFRIGNGTEGNDLLLVDKHALINGTSIAGAFRNFLENRKNDIFSKVFSNDGEISCVYFYDSYSFEEIKNEDLRLRDHVKIDYKSSTSLGGCLFNKYHISEGKHFDIAFEIRAFEMKEEIYGELCTLIEDFIYLLSEGKITLGSNTTFGFGEFEAVDDLYEKEFDLSKKEDLEEYLSSEKIEKKNLIKSNKREVESEEIEIKFKGYCEDGLIVRGKVEKELVQGKSDTKKSVQNSYFEGGFYVIPASTIKGVVRSYISKIYNTLKKEDLGDLEEIFGGQNNENQDKIKGKVVFHDVKLKKENTQVYNRIKIDRFTGGVSEGGVFSEKLVVSNKNNPIEIKITLKEEDNKALALIILALRDIGFGYVSIGSGDGVGYGLLNGISIGIDGNKYKKCKVHFENKTELVGDLDIFEEIISKELG